MGLSRDIVGMALKPFVFNYLKKKNVIHFRRERLFNELMFDLMDYGDTSLKEKLWCYRKGFLSDKKFRYRINEGNYKDYLSDLDFYRRDNYKNIRFSRFFDDKLMTHYFLNEFKQYLPKHFFFNTGGRLFKFDKHEYADIPALLQDVNEVAAKNSFGRHGEGFLKFMLKDGVYSINNVECSAEDIRGRSAELENFIFTEYVANHPDLLKAAPISSMVYRLATINDPELGPGIIGISTRWQRSGKTLIVDQPGGVQCGVDMEKGTFFRAIDIMEGEVAAEGGPIESYGLPEQTPYFEEMKRMALEISTALEYAPYLSFDIAIGINGPRVLEINSHGITRALQMFRPYFKDERARRLFVTSW